MLITCTNIWTEPEAPAPGQPYSRMHAGAHSQIGHTRSLGIIIKHIFLVLCKIVNEETNLAFHFHLRHDDAGLASFATKHWF